MLFKAFLLEPVRSLANLNLFQHDLQLVDPAFYLFRRTAILDVTDRIIDTTKDLRPLLQSKGVMTSFGSHPGQPQIVTYGDENRIGFCLFVGGRDEEVLSNQGLFRVYGTLTGMTIKSVPFTRKSLLIKWKDEPENAEQDEEYRRTEKTMFNVTGIFERKEIKARAARSELFYAARAIEDGFRVIRAWQDPDEILDPLRTPKRSKTEGLKARGTQHEVAGSIPSITV